MKQRIKQFCRFTICRLFYGSRRLSSVGTNFTLVGIPFYQRNPNVYIGDNVTIYPNVSFFGEGKIIIGNHVKIGNNCIIYSGENHIVRIGDYTSIAANCYIINSDHQISQERFIQQQPMNSSDLLIGKDVWIAANSVIARGSKLNDGVVVGANSFVNSELSKNMLAFGSPAKEIKSRPL